MRSSILVFTLMFLFGCTSAPASPPIPELNPSTMQQDETLKILSDFAEVVEKNSIELKDAGVFGNPENTLPYPKSTVREAILTSYEQSGKTERDKEIFGTAYMALGTFGNFSNEQELKKETQKWAFEWFEMTGLEKK